MENERLQKQIRFLMEIDALKSILRQNYLSDGSRRENDVEHSWHLAMLVMILEEYFEGLDVLKTVRMVLIHDLVEIYAGDTFAYDAKANEDKAEREQMAAEKIFSVLPEDQYKEYKELWQEFEEMESKEAVCAAITDRIQPLLLHIGTKGMMWKAKGITADKVRWRNQIVLEKGPVAVRDFIASLISDAEEKGYFYTSADEGKIR